MARYVEYKREMTYRIFVTDALYEDEKHMRIVPKARFIDSINPKKVEPERSAEEIAAEIIRKAGLVVKK